MEIMIALILMISLLVMLVFIIILVTKKFKGGSQTYNVFEFLLDEGKLKVCTGIPVIYNISDIQIITFSMMKNKGNHMGIFKITLVNGKKSRPFMFDYSVCTKKISWINTKENIDEATTYLMNELREKMIQCEKRI